MIPALSIKFHVIQTPTGFTTIAIMEAEFIEKDNYLSLITQEIEYHIAKVNELKQELWRLQTNNTYSPIHEIIASATTTKHIPAIKTPTTQPTTQPTTSPTQTPTNSPTKSPTQTPTHSPTKVPTLRPTRSPTQIPTNSPTESPTDRWDHKTVKSSSSKTKNNKIKNSARIADQAKYKSDDEILEECNPNKVKIFVIPNNDDTHLYDLESELSNDPKTAFLLTVYHISSPKAKQYYSSIDVGFWIAQSMVQKLYSNKNLIDYENGHNLMNEFVMKSCHTLANNNKSIANRIFTHLNQLYPNPKEHEKQRLFILDLMVTYNQATTPSFEGCDYVTKVEVFFEYFAKYMEVFVDLKLREMQSSSDYVFPLQQFMTSFKANIAVAKQRYSDWYKNEWNGVAATHGVETSVQAWKDVAELTQVLRSQSEGLCLFKAEYDIARFIHGWKASGGYGTVAVSMRVRPSLLHTILQRHNGCHEQQLELWNAVWIDQETQRQSQPDQTQTRPKKRGKSGNKAKIKEFTMKFNYTRVSFMEEAIDPATLNHFVPPAH